MPEFTQKQNPDLAKIDAFSNRMLDILNGAMLSLMIGIGHKTNLFEVMADLPPSNSERIARTAGLQERYVREWLAAMVAGRIIRHDPITGHYHLPAENAAVLTRTAGADNMARLALVIPFLASVQEDIVTAFFKGGGVPYSSYPDFLKLWAEIHTEKFNASINPATLSSFMPDVVGKMHRGVEVLDIGCGDGHALCLMAEAFPNSRFTGCDLLEGGIRTAREKKRSLGLTNIDFHVRDITILDESNRYALITAFDVIHDMARPDRALRSVADALKTGGTFLMVDMAASSHLQENLDHPLGPWLYTTSCMHCMPVSLALDGAGLGAMWGEQKALEMLNEAGFVHVQVKKIQEDLFNNYYIARKAG